MTGFGELFAKTHDVRVIVPTHPGFGGTARPDALTSIPDLAALYVALIDQLGLEDVTVIGNSIGGWIAAEMALLASPRVSGVILVDAVGIEVPGHPIADFFSLTMDQVFTLSFHNPEPFRIDPGDAAARRAGHRRRQPRRPGRLRRSGDERPHPGRTARPPRAAHPGAVGRQRPDRRPRLRPRLRRRHPTARFQLLKDTGHLPQLETPDQLMNAIWNSADTFSGQRAPGLS